MFLRKWGLWLVASVVLADAFLCDLRALLWRRQGGQSSGLGHGQQRTTRSLGKHDGQRRQRSGGAKGHAVLEGDRLLAGGAVQPAAVSLGTGSETGPTTTPRASGRARSRARKVIGRG